MLIISFLPTSLADMLLAYYTSQPRNQHNLICYRQRLSSSKETLLPLPLIVRMLLLLLPLLILLPPSPGIILLLLSVSPGTSAAPPSPQYIPAHSPDTPAATPHQDTAPGVPVVTAATVTVAAKQR